MNQIIIFYGILRLIPSKRRMTSILPVRTFFWQNWYLYHHCRSNFIQQSSVDQNSNYHFIYLPFGVNCKMFLYVESVIKRFSDLVANTLARLPLILLLRLNKLRVPIHNSVNRLWTLDVSWNPKAISKSSDWLYRKFRPTASHGFKFYPKLFTCENTFTARNQYTVMTFSRYFSNCWLDWIY